MKDYSTLKREIQTYIRTNNNQEITGEVLQNVLVSIVSNVGENAGFGGIAKKATSPGTPDGPVFYFATEQGVYPNFGGLEIERENTLNILYNTEDGWDTLFLGNLVPNEEVEDFRTFKHLENMRFEEASEYCATFDNIIEKIGDGAIRFSRPVIFTFSSLGTEQGMIINLPSSSRMIVQYAFTKGNVNSGFSHRLIQYDLASLTITNVGEWKPISSLIPAATTSDAGLMSADDKVKLGKLDKAVVDLAYDETERDAASYKFYLEQRKADGTTEPTPVELHAATTSDAGVMTSTQVEELGKSISGITSARGSGSVTIFGNRNDSSSPAITILPLAKSEEEGGGAPQPGIMSNTDKDVLGVTDGLIVTNCSDNIIDTYTTRGTYRVHGERTNANDGLPILNSNPGHTVEGVLKVLDSSISGSGETTDKVVTQILTMSNRTGGDGHIWVRTGQGANKTSLTWSTWEKMQGIFEKNIITTDPLEALDSFTTNGMYSGIFTQPFSVNFSIGTYSITTASQFLVVTVNGYNLASPQLGGQTPVIMQNIYLVFDGRYIALQRSGTWNGTRWVYAYFRGQSNISINQSGDFATQNINGDSSIYIHRGLKFTYSDGILTITAGDGKKTVLTLS